jgi:hypothetical protein
MHDSPDDRALRTGDVNVKYYGLFSRVPVLCIVRVLRHGGSCEKGEIWVQARNKTDAAHVSVMWRGASESRFLVATRRYGAGIVAPCGDEMDLLRER